MRHIAPYFFHRALDRSGQEIRSRGGSHPICHDDEVNECARLYAVHEEAIFHEREGIPGGHRRHRDKRTVSTRHVETPALDAT